MARLIETNTSPMQQVEVDLVTLDLVENALRNARYEMDEVLFLNPDLTVNLHRLPVGEWVCIDAVTRLGSEGVGLAESLLFDEQGPIGRATQSLLVEAR